MNVLDNNKKKEKSYLKFDFNLKLTYKNLYKYLFILSLGYH